MTTLNSTRRTYGSLLNDSIIYSPLLLLAGLLVLSSPSTSGSPRLSMIGPLAAIGVIAVTLFYAARLKTGRAALTRRLQESDELSRMVSEVTSSDTFADSVRTALQSMSRQF